MRAPILILALLVGCGDGARPSSSGELTLAWTAAGLAPGKFAPVEAKGLAGTCQAGEVSGLEVTVCEHADAAAAQAQQEPGLAVVGAATGAAVAEGKLLVVVADRRGQDPDGKKIDKLTRALRGR
jgi:hypothetical protein